MRHLNFLNVIVAIYCLTSHNTVYAGYVNLTHDGPIVPGGIITFQADLYYNDGTRPSGTFVYIWRDNAIPPHTYESQSTENTTYSWRVQYPADTYPVGEYTVDVKVQQKISMFWPEIVSQHRIFKINPRLNDTSITEHSNYKTVTSKYASFLENLIKFFSIVFP